MPWAIDEIAKANGVSNKVTYLIYSPHHADHAGAASLFGKDVVRVGHSTELGERSLVPGTDARQGEIRFEDWLAQSVAPAPAAKA